MKYSVLASVYAKEKVDYLRLSIDSILNQSIKTDDFVIVKDGPLNKELDNILKEYQQQYECIRIVELKKNVGLGCALNEGIKYCKNDLVARMDTDDIAEYDRCELQLREFELDNDLDIIGSWMYEFYDDPDKIISIKKVPLTYYEIYQYGKRRNPFNHPTVMFKKSTIIKYGGYSEMRQGQDHELFTRLLLLGCKGKNIDKCLIKFRSDINMYKRRKSWNSIKSYFKVVWKRYKEGYSNISDVCFVAITQLGLIIIPISMGKFIYRKFFRS